MGYSSFGLGPCLAEGVLCFELCEQRLTPPMSNSLFRVAGIKRCIFSVFLLGFRTFYPLHVLEPPQNHPFGNNATISAPSASPEQAHYCRRWSPFSNRCT